MVDTKLATALPADVLRTREKLHMARYVLKAAAQATTSAREKQRLGQQTELLDWLIALSGDFVELADGLLAGEGNVAGSRHARWFNTLGELAEKWEEIVTREDVTLPERMADALSFVLGRLGDTSFIKGASAAYTYDTLALRTKAADHVWTCYELCDTEPASAERGAAIRDGVAAITEVVFDRTRTPTAQRVAVGALYLMLLGKGLQEFAARQ